MSEYLHVTGLHYATPNTETKDIRFALSMSEGEPIMCAASYGVAAQISSGLGAAIQISRMALTAQRAMEPIAPQHVRDTVIQKEKSSDAIVMQLTTVLGVPYIFQFSSQIAFEIADQLKNEAAKPTQVGNA